MHGSVLKKRVTVVCGHYGCGKTNLSINLAVGSARSGERPVLVDLDVVNPYFRSSDYSEALEAEGVKVVGPNFASTNLDTPSLPASVEAAIESGERVIVDSGGDDAGAAALGRYSGAVAAGGYDMLYVVNERRNLTSAPEEAARILREIEGASRLAATGIVNNSHLKEQTVPETVAHSADFAEAVSRITGLQIVFTTVPRGLLAMMPPMPDLLPIDIYVKTPWE